MSIILDALKKAQSSKEKIEDKDKGLSGNSSGVFQAKPLVSKSKSPPNKLRIILLAIVAVLGLALVTFYSYGPKFTTLFSTASVPKYMPKKPNITPNTKDGKGALTLDEDAQKQKERDKDKKVAQLRNEATMKFQNGRYDESAAIYEKLVNLLPSNAEVYNNFGVALKKAGKFTEAKKAYNTALALNPDYAEALNNLAVIEMSDRNYNNARRRLEKAIEVNPNYLDAYLHLALCLEKVGDVSMSLDYYRTFLDLSEGKVSRKLRIQIENHLSRLTEDL